jgi:hypothetical protein
MTSSAMSSRSVISIYLSIEVSTSRSNLLNPATPVSNGSKTLGSIILMLISTEVVTSLLHCDGLIV